MTTIVPFIQPPTEPFQFQPTLDGQIYNALVPWNLFGQRLYLSIYSLSGILIFNLPLIGSLSGTKLEDISWSNGTVTATTILPHGYKITDTIDLAVSGCVPNAYNGQVEVLITSETQFTYQISGDNPGPATILGMVSHDINLAGGYFQTSTLVFRQDAQQFEIVP